MNYFEYKKLRGFIGGEVSSDIAMDEEAKTTRELQKDLVEHKKTCEAKPGNCPYEKDLKEKIDESQQGEQGDIDTGNVNPEGEIRKKAVGEAITDNSEDMHEYEYDEMEKYIRYEIEEFKRGKAIGFEYIDMGTLRVNFETELDISPYEEISTDENGKLQLKRELTLPYDFDKTIEEDVAALNEYMGKFGLGTKGPLKYGSDSAITVDDVEQFKWERASSRYGADRRLVGSGSGIMCHDLVVSDAKKFQELKDSFKAGGSRRTKYLDERVREDEEWKASPEYKEYAKEMERRFPGTYWQGLI